MRNKLEYLIFQSYKAVKKLLAIIFFLIGLNVNAAIRTSTAAGGSWSVGATWVGGVAPVAGDDAVIATTGGNSVTLGAVSSIRNFTINSGAKFNDGNFNFTVSGNTLINGTYNGNGTGRLLLTGNGATLDGTGTINNVNRMDMTASTTKTILSTANLTFTGATQRIDVKSNNTITNNGTVTVSRITGAAATSVWINATNAVLNIGADLLSTGTLTANASGNSINYNGAVAQTIKTTTYYHLTLSGSNAKTAAGALTVNGNFTTSGTATFNGGTSRTHTFLGNWVINSTAATPFSFTTASTINFNTPGTPAATSLGGTSAATIGFNIVNLNNTSGFSSNLNFNITGTLTVAANVIFTPAAAVVINSASTQGTITGSGTVRVTRTAATANYQSQYKFTTHTLTNLTVDYAGTAAQSANALTYGNLKMSNTSAAVTASGNITVNGVLTLNGNLSGGDLAMGANTLTMGASATTVGLGDVTGIVKRTTLNSGTAYSFGNQYTLITFNAVGTLPTDVSVKISIGAAPSWKTGAINRYYDVMRTGGSGFMYSIQLHYRDAELNGNTENILSLFDDDEYPVISEHGQSGSNTTQNWAERSNYVDMMTSFGTTSGWTLGNKTVGLITWNGNNSTNWNDAGNWTGGIPGATDDVVIPDAATTANDPTVPASTTIQSLIINAGGIVNGGTGTSLTISGTSSWINSGTFNPGTSTVSFTSSSGSISGETNFYNVTIATGADVTMQTDNIMRIAGTMTNNGIWRARLVSNTVEYNGTDQTIINPSGGTPGYHHLILSNSGTKTANTNIIVENDFTMLGTAVFHGGTSLTHTLGSWIIHSSAATPFSYTTASTINFDEPRVPAATSLGGTSSATIGFNNVNVNNTSGFSASLNFNITGTLTVAANVTFTPAAAVVINSASTQGTITGSGTVRVSRAAATADYQSQYKFTTHTLTNLTVDYAGTAAQSANSLTYGNLTMSNTSAAVTASGNITVNGVLTLNANLSGGDLAMGVNTLTMGASATTTGLGDVTGIVKRTTINSGTSYSFGNQFTTITFASGGTLPTDVSVKISIGAAPSWKTDALNRYYDVIQTGGSASSLTLQFHYRDDELNGNTNGNIDIWHYHFGNGDVEEHGNSNYNSTDNWVNLTGIGIDVFTSNFGDYEYSIADKVLTVIIWEGDFSTDWTNSGNWLGGGVPGSSDAVVIPIPPNPSHFSPTLPATTTIKSLRIDSGGTLNGGTGSILTILDDSGWVNNGTFNPGTSRVVFSGTNAIIGGTDTINLYDLTISVGSKLTVLDNSVIRIAGTFTNDGNFDAATGMNSTIEYCGGNQNIINSLGGYCHIILSGSGTKILLGDLYMCGNLTVSGTSQLDVSASNYNIAIGGNWDNHSSNADPFLQRSGYVNFSGSILQTISNPAGEIFYDLNISNTFGEIRVIGTTNITTTNNLTLTSGVITTGSNIFALSNTTPASCIFINGFVHGTFRRYIVSNTSTYEFFVADGIDADEVHRISFINNSISGVSYLDASVTDFVQATPNNDAALNTTQSATPIISTVGELGTTDIWTLTPDATPTGGSYGVRLYVFNTNLTAADDDMFCILKRNNTASFANFLTYDATTTIPAAGTAGRVYNAGNGYAERTGYTSFSQFVIGKSAVPLPVELLTFDAKPDGNSVNVQWSTASERNSDYFLVERASPSSSSQNGGLVFLPIGTVKGAGNSSMINHYRFVDSSPEGGGWEVAAFYRLRQVDYDGKFTFSKIVSVNFNNENVGMSVYPNPSGKDQPFYINISGKNGKEVLVVVRDAQGIEYYSKINIITSDKEVIAIDPSGKLTSGIYIVVATSNNDIYEKKIVIK